MYTNLKLGKCGTNSVSDLAALKYFLQVSYLLETEQYIGEINLLFVVINQLPPGPVWSLVFVKKILNKIFFFLLTLLKFEIISGRPLKISVSITDDHVTANSEMWNGD